MTILEQQEVIWLFHELVFSGIVILSCAFYFSFNENKKFENLSSPVMTNDMCIGIFYLYVTFYKKKHNQTLEGKYYMFQVNGKMTAFSKKL